MDKTFLSHDQESQIDALFKEWDTDHTPGAAVGIIKDGEFVYKKCFGMANLEYGIPITPDSKFYLASVSKQFTAACIALLILDGKLSIDDDVRKFIPELPKYDKTITIKHLLHHTSGLLDYNDLFIVKYGHYATHYYDNDEALRWIYRQKDLSFPVGERHVYCNSGYILLAEIVKRLSGQTLREFSDSRIFKPLGMENTFFRDDLNEIIKNRVYSYHNLDKNSFETAVEMYALVGPSGLISSLNDLLKWIVNYSTGKIGDKDFLKIMNSKEDFTEYEGFDYGFGLKHEYYNGIEKIHHGGGTFAFFHDTIRFPGKNISIILLANRSDYNRSALMKNITNIIFGFKENKTEISPISVDHEKKQSYCGHYWNNESGYSLEIFLKGNELFSLVNGISKTKLLCNAEHMFMWEGDSTYTITFSITDSPKKVFVTKNQLKTEELSEYEPVKSDETYLQQFVGNYFSEDLLVNYSFQIDNSELVQYRDGVQMVSLKPLMKDKFRSYWAMPITFTRNEHGEVIGFTFMRLRARNIRFKKIKKGLLQ